MKYEPLDLHAADMDVPELDVEHRGQIERMNRVGLAITARRPAAEVIEAVDDLADYLDAHFVSEQISMRGRAYPQFEAHASEHDLAMDLLRALQKRVAAGDPAAALEVLSGLTSWLVVHLRTSDADYARFIRS